MKIIKPGVEYQVTDFADNERFQTIKFTEKLAGSFQAGTTNEEVINENFPEDQETEMERRTDLEKQNSLNS